ncbi:hypothetical protein QA612_09895 [Evansella sp. AB-P1]|uniref:hypothetical protein n=1 Tax=Evansella sp. AB-P1 TaxID=3037653 RepID=UPI00241DE95D|nr:hypothetical protein [Evansella sp. AB-P1]MDG5787811.1 hypothetical protein [Evansella sp. AB-P1]
MLYTKLKTIYEAKPFLEKHYPFDQYYPLLQSHITKEIKLNAEYFNPYRFANEFSLDSKKSLNFFISLSTGKATVFEKNYQYNCVNCNLPKILTSFVLTEMLVCDECYTPFFIEDENSLKYIEFIFKLKSEILTDVKQQIKKVQSSSKETKRDLEEDREQSSSNPNIADVHNQKGPSTPDVDWYREQIAESLRVSMRKT